MVFSSLVFLLYFLPLCLVVYYITPQRFRNTILLLFSVVFYAYGAPEFVLILLGSSALSFYLVKAMHNSQSPQKRKTLCAIAIVVSLSLLGYFKYSNFLVENINYLLGLVNRHWLWDNVLLPIGISFFTFQSITYVVDVYRGENPPMNKLRDYLLYITMFPQLIAGPIVRYGDVAEQISNRTLSYQECLQGFYRFVVGLCKKILVADVIGRWVDSALQLDFYYMDSATAWVVIVAYTMQLYFDFSGYSDMAIGLGRMLGFRFPENFNNPYNSSSVTEFWRRWHITLGAFMRNYLYIPLGGNRTGVGRTYLNLWLVFLLSGLWHGASWNFIIWGAYHGFWLVVERLGGLKILQKLGRLPSVLITFVIVVVGWSFFRIEGLQQAFLFVSRLFAFSAPTSAIDIDSETVAMLVIALICAFSCLTPWGRKLEQKIYYHNYTSLGHPIIWLFCVLAFVFCVAALCATNFSPFIYFRF